MARQSGNLGSKSSLDPWEQVETVTWVKCSVCGCVNRYDEAQADQLATLYRDGYGMRKGSIFCYCNCHSGIGLLPKLLVKTEVE